MVVGLGSQRDGKMPCAITASVQARCVRTRGVEMLVSSEVESRATNKRLRARRKRMPRPAEVVGSIEREAVSQVQGYHVIVYLARVEQVCWKNGIQLLFVVLEGYPLQLFLQACGRVQG